METQGCIIIFAVLWIHGCEMQIHSYTPEFWRVLYSLNDTDGWALKMKIYFENRKAYGRDKSLQLNAFSLNGDMFRCHTKLLKILTEDLRCPDLAKKLKPPLDIMEYLYNVETDENVLKSYLDFNCTDLSGKSASTCKLMKSGPWNLFSSEMLTSLIDQCRLHYNDRARESTRALSPRYQKEMF